MRRRRAEQRETLADPKYHNKVVSRFVNTVMLKGKKSTAERLVYGAFDIISERTGKKDPIEIFTKAVDNVRPLLEVKSRRVGGATYQVPLEVKQDRGISIALRWMRNYARSRKGKNFADRLAQEILDAYKKEGASVKKREDTHKMAEANKAFSHFRW